MRDAALRRELLALLDGGHAHVAAGKAFAGLAPRLRGVRPDGGGHSAWELLEHLRIAQEDILRYVLDPGWKSPSWPEGYWPPPGAPTAKRWGTSLRAFVRDLEAVKELVRDPARDLTAPLPQARQHTVLREVLLVADHNAYHLGQVVEVRRRLGAWGTD